MHYVDVDKCQSDILDFTTGVRQESIIFYDDRFIIYICICMLRAISSTLLALVDHFNLFFQMILPSLQKCIWHIFIV